MEERSRTLFHESVDSVDMGTRSQLTQARYAALAAAAGAARRPWFLRLPAAWTSAGVTAAAVLGAVLWVGMTPLSQGPAEAQPNLEDLEMVASTDESSGDAMEMLQEDPDFYDWADKAASGSGPSA